MTNENILINLILCGLLGLLGQGVRVVIGLKKLEEAAATQSQDSKDKAENDPNVSVLTAKAIYDESFDGRQLGLSLLIGFVAGCLSSLTRKEGEVIDHDVQLAIIAAGYAGTDFIEGVFKKILPTN